MSKERRTQRAKEWLQSIEDLEYQDPKRRLLLRAGPEFVRSLLIAIEGENPWEEDTIDFEAITEDLPVIKECA